MDSCRHIFRKNNMAVFCFRGGTGLYGAEKGSAEGKMVIRKKKGAAL